ncbi:hypothetical protein HBH98_191150 [Parastagonospora nodorum]|nr:hypothetical protein HBH52_176880 [Parastagonospora nodorum]KAH4020720.1 hypothetical protein HBI09_179130 [Parastagonospora nodorum]KAH4044793.1 hypothetical protein HBH49_213260 [Parastagonospora nodorum]KAH4095484.1 hypothetical protein HBH46_168560 [Parastagonospora nodorum]KAH4160010.1 hypothetical protein HBH43_180460 [Parastagonospora nodorum]
MYIYYLNESECASHSEREYQKATSAKSEPKNSTAQHVVRWGKKKSLPKGRPTERE